MKEDLDDHNNSESLYRAVTDFMDSLNREEYRKTSDRRIERMRLRVDNNDDYFEDLMK